MDIKIERTNKDLSSVAGLVLFKELADKALPDSTFTLDHLPSLKAGIKKNIAKFRQLLFGFHAGAECLDDLEKLSQDIGFKAVNNGKTYTSKALGNFLRSFSQMHCKHMNILLMHVAYRMRSILFPNQKSITLDIDSTQNAQSGSKMEGVRANYAGISGLNSIQVFDEFGLQYWHDVRPGNTHTAEGSLEIIHRIFHNLDTNLKALTRYVRADSGYCKIGFLHACAAKKAQFVVCMRKLMYLPLVSKVSQWQAQDKDDSDRIMFVGKRECEIG